eukprot:446287_1
MATTGFSTILISILCITSSQRDYSQAECNGPMLISFNDIGQVDLITGLTSIYQSYSFSSYNVTIINPPTQNGDTASTIPTLESVQISPSSTLLLVWALITVQPSSLFQQKYLATVNIDAVPLLVTLIHPITFSPTLEHYLLSGMAIDCDGFIFIIERIHYSTYQLDPDTGIATFLYKGSGNCASPILGLCHEVIGYNMDDNLMYRISSGGSSFRMYRRNTDDTETESTISDPDSLCDHGDGGGITAMEYIGNELWLISCTFGDAVVRLLDTHDFDNPIIGPIGTDGVVYPIGTDGVVYPTGFIGLSDTSYCTPQCPTLNPTNTPTQKPTPQPTVSPTDDPSHQPTTFTPTVSPTTKPTRLPTDDPSHQPTNNPTTNTLMPTECPDDDIDVQSNNGEDIIATLNLFDVLTLFDRNISKMNNSNSEIFQNVGWNANVQCHNDTETCNVQCTRDHDGTCAYMNVVTRWADIQQIVIECSGRHACISSRITISDSNIQFIDIICAELGSCLSMNIVIEQSKIAMFTIQCQGSISCASMSITFKSESYINLSILKCMNENGCRNLRYIVNDTIIENTTIICSHQYSCNSSSITINHNSNDVYEYLSLHCIYHWACEGLKMYSNSHNDMANSMTQINCYQGYACNDLFLERAEAAEPIWFELKVYNFSKNINIHSLGANVRLKILCGNENDKRFIRYNTNSIKTERELIELARREYTGLNRLPCEEIHIDCTSNDYFPKSCDWKYQLNDINLQKFMMSMDDTDLSCYWVELSKLLTANCSGTCNTDLDLYNYNQSLKLDIRTTEPKSLNNSNSSTSQILTICNEFFGTINDTLYTLYEIDAIFEFILRVTFTPFQIYDITDGPFSELADGVAQLNCSTFEGITLDTSMNLVSGIDNKQTFDTLFGEEFISEVERLLSLLFDFDVNVIVTIINEEDVVHVIEGFELWHLLCILTGMIIVVILLVYYYNYLRYNKRIEIKNPMIITVAIGIYDPDPPNPEVINGGLSDLYGIDKDVRNLFGLFRDQMHYTFFPNHDLSTIKMQWSKEEIMNLLHEKAIELSQNLNIFDGLVVIMSGHGMDECILTSDYKMIEKKHIHRLFSIHKDVIQCRSIPRLFIFDCYSDRSYIDEEEEKGKGNNDVDYKVLYENNAPWARDEENPDHKLAVVHAENQDFHSQMRTTIGSDLIGQFVEKMKINCERDGVCCSHNKLFLGEIMGEIQDELERQGNQLPECKFNNGTENIIFITNESKDKNPTESAIQLSELKSLNEVDHPLERDLNVNKSVQDLNEMNRMSSDELMNKIGGIIKPSNEAVEIDDTQLQFGEVLCSM